jgi:glycosylphosphatidylinositol transamidase (GPIT) subunit GPI8
MHCEHLTVKLMVLFVLLLSASRQMMGNTNNTACLIASTASLVM